MARSNFKDTNLPKGKLSFEEVVSDLYTGLPPELVKDVMLTPKPKVKGKVVPKTARSSKKSKKSNRKKRSIRGSQA